MTLQITNSGLAYFPNSSMLLSFMNGNRKKFIFNGSQILSNHKRISQTNYTFYNYVYTFSKMISLSFAKTCFDLY